MKLFQLSLGLMLSNLGQIGDLLVANALGIRPESVLNPNLKVPPPQTPTNRIGF